MANLPQTHPLTISAAQRGDPQAWAQIYQDWHALVLGWCRVYGGPDIDIENAAQESFVRLHRIFYRYQEGCSFPSFFRGITRRVAHEQRNRAWIRRWLPGIAPETVSAFSGSAFLAQRQLGRQIDEILATLPERYREAIWLKDGEGFSAPEIAELLGVSTETVRTRLSRGRKMFRERFSHQESADV